MVEDRKRDLDDGAELVSVFVASAWREGSFPQHIIQKHRRVAALDTHLR